MAFRRQDIPNTVRAQKDGGPPRIYPRFLRDDALLPKIRIAIDYLERMTGRRRGDLDADTLVDLFGDPKIARCLVACLADHYVYRLPEMAEVLGVVPAAALADWGIGTPADLRASCYLAANTAGGGFVAPDTRDTFLAGVGDALGIEPVRLDTLLHLDAERNAILERAGAIPDATDVLARYNVMLCLSVLRHASRISLDLPRLDPADVAAICARHEVELRRNVGGNVVLFGRRSNNGSWSAFGTRIARCALHLVLRSPAAPVGQATVHFGDRTLNFVLDAKTIAFIRPAERWAASPDQMVDADRFAADFGKARRETPEAGPWRVGRWPNPVVVAGGILLPELEISRGTVRVPVVDLAAAAPVARIVESRPVLLVEPDRESVDVLAVADAIASAATIRRSPLERVEAELQIDGWLVELRLRELLGETADIAVAVEPLVQSGGAVWVAGFGLCRPTLVYSLAARLIAGPVDVEGLRRSVSNAVAGAPGADALTLYLLGSAPRIAFTARSAGEALDAA